MRKNSKILFLLICLFETALILTSIRNINGQTKIVAPKNDYPITKDIAIGSEEAKKIESANKIIDNPNITNYVQRVGDKLVSNIPSEFKIAEFRYSFKVLNSDDVNAFALPGGPMFINRGLVENVQNEGELASVLAHEITHVILRHGTSKLTKLNENQPGAINQVLSDNAVCGILGDLCNVLLISQQIGTLSYLNVYDREYETQADVLGLQILTKAGYDPQDMAKMLRLLKSEPEGKVVPTWLKSHPDTEARIVRVEQEIKTLTISKSFFQTGQLAEIKAELKKIPNPDRKNNPAKTNPTSSQESEKPTVGYKTQIPIPSPKYRQITSEVISLQVPENWYDHIDGETIFITPNGGFGEQGATHGIMLSFYRQPNSNLEQTIQKFLDGILSANPYLKLQQKTFTSKLGGRDAVVVVLAGQSPVTSKTEVVNLYVTPLRSDVLFYLATVVPQNEQEAYKNAFIQIVSSFKFGAK